jgi:hypothetical protein
MYAEHMVLAALPLRTCTAEHMVLAAHLLRTYTAEHIVLTANLLRVCTAGIPHNSNLVLFPIPHCS